ncbi:MAG: hypothetical protein J0L76_14955 [Rhodobacterales bacterium]|nr:hypothetical protein [Rhodobacterales bacterium]
MFFRLLALAVFVVLSPVGDAINGYLKAPEGSCSALAVLSADRMAFLCSDGLAVARITSRAVPSVTHPACATEALRGMQAFLALKYSLYAARDIRTYSFHREGAKFYAGMLIDLETVEMKYRATMPALLDVDVKDWCPAAA